MQRFFRRRNIQHHEAVPAATTDKAGRGVPLTPLAEERAKVEPRKRGPRLRGPFALALALVLPVCATTALAQPAAATPAEFAATFKTSDLQRQVQELTGIYHLWRYCPYRPVQENEISRAGDLLREIRLHARRHKKLG